MWGDKNCPHMKLLVYDHESGGVYISVGTHQERGFDLVEMTILPNICDVNYKIYIFIFLWNKWETRNWTQQNIIPEKVKCLAFDNVLYFKMCFPHELSW